MPEEIKDSKRLMKCVACNTTYNITQLKAGTKFKCKKCGTINTIPEVPVPKEEPLLLLEEEPPPSPPPSPRITRPSTRISRDSRYQRSGSSRFTKPTKTDEEAAEEKPKKNNTLIFAGIGTGVLVLGIIIYAVSTSGHKEMPDTKPGKASGSGETSSESTKPPPEIPEWRVDKQLKAEVEEIIRALKSTTENSIEYKGLLQRLHLKEKEAVIALIDLLNHPEKGIAHEALKQLEWRTDLKFEHLEDRNTLFKKWKNYWLSEGKNVSLPDKSASLVVPRQVEETSPSSRRKPSKSEFIVNETLKAEIEPLLKMMREQSDEEIKRGMDKIIAKGKEVIPVLILEIGNEDEWIARYASDILILMTQRPDAPKVNQLISHQDRLELMEDWQEWWRQNKDK